MALERYRNKQMIFPVKEAARAKPDEVTFSPYSRARIAMILRLKITSSKKKRNLFRDFIFNKLMHLI